jgi:hypothetical protein
MRQGSSEDAEFAGAKDNLWQQDENGNWRIDPDRDVLRMANHTRVYHQKPTLQESIDAVRKQFYSGEGAIQYAPEAIAQYSRSVDPIVGVSFTGLFDFFVNAFGVEWLRWWEAGRPDTVTGMQFKEREKAYLSRWSEIVHRVVWEYCDRQSRLAPTQSATVYSSDYVP